MGQLAIVYATLTRYSKKIAVAMDITLRVKAENVSTSPVLGEVDLLYIVGGIYGGKSLPSLMKFVKTLDPARVKRAVLVTSCARKQRQDGVRMLLQEKGIEVLEEILCPGSFLFLSYGHPNEGDIQRTADSAARLAEMG